MFVFLKDTDECAPPNQCGNNAICENTIGSFECIMCEDGFEGDNCQNGIDKRK